MTPPMATVHGVELTIFVLAPSPAPSQAEASGAPRARRGNVREQRDPGQAPPPRRRPCKTPISAVSPINTLMRATSRMKPVRERTRPGGIRHPRAPCHARHEPPSRVSGNTATSATSAYARQDRQSNLSGSEGDPLHCSAPAQAPCVGTGAAVSANNPDPLSGKRDNGSSYA